MKKLFLLLIVVFTVGCGSSNYVNDNSHVYYETDLTDHIEDDLFHVTVYPPKLKSENNIFNFVSTAPGTYQNLNIGRFVKSFTVYDKDGNELKSENISTNEWKIENPEEVYKIVYSIEDSYDTELDDDLIMPMSGTGIEDKYVVLNTFGVYGYFEGLQSFPVKLKVDYPDDWTAATTMTQRGEYYYASSYDELSDSPILLGELTYATTNVAGIDVDVYVYSDSDIITADIVLEKANNVLTAAGKFLNYPLVDRYKFLMTFFDNERAQRNKFSNIGALEHSYSSLYAMNATQNVLNILDGFMAHEFFHIVTPLNLHSEIIEKYNFKEPVPSQHLWLYESTTEWVAHTMQLRDSLIDLETYLSRIRQKLNTAQNFFDADYSIYQISTEAYTTKGGQEYINIYQKGAVIIALLDLKLLELSNGTRGLREVILDLTKKFGKSKPFPEKEFFKIFVENTYPEIEEFFNKYIKDAQPLPLKEYFEKVGIKYTYKEETDEPKSNFGFFAFPNSNGEIQLNRFNKEYDGGDFKTGDILLKLNGEDLTPQTGQAVNRKYSAMEPGTEVEFLVRRDGNEITIKSKLYKNYSYNNFEIMEDVTPQQLKLREAWTKNLPL